MEITTNWHIRDLKAGYEIGEIVWNEFFDYLGTYAMKNEHTWQPRFFQYKNWWYDTHEFEVIGHDAELFPTGWMALALDSVWSGIAIRYPLADEAYRDRYDAQYNYEAVIVASVYWG